MAHCGKTERGRNLNFRMQHVCHCTKTLKKKFCQKIDNFLSFAGLKSKIGLKNQFLTLMAYCGKTERGRNLNFRMQHVCHCTKTPKKKFCQKVDNFLNFARLSKKIVDFVFFQEFGSWWLIFGAIFKFQKPAQSWMPTLSHQPHSRHSWQRTPRIRQNFVFFLFFFVCCCRLTVFKVRDISNRQEESQQEY